MDKFDNTIGALVGWKDLGPLFCEAAEHRAGAPANPIQAVASGVRRELRGLSTSKVAVAMWLIEAGIEYFVELARVGTIRSAKHL